MWLVNHQILVILNTLLYISSVSIINSYTCLLNCQSKAALPCTSLPPFTLQCPQFLSYLLSHPPQGNSIFSQCLFTSRTFHGHITSWLDLSAAQHSLWFPVPPVATLIFWSEFLLADHPLNKYFVRMMVGPKLLWRGSYVSTVPGRKNPGYG